MLLSNSPCLKLRVKSHTHTHTHTHTLSLSLGLVAHSNFRCPWVGLMVFFKGTSPQVNTAPRIHQHTCQSPVWSSAHTHTHTHTHTQTHTRLRSHQGLVMLDWSFSSKRVRDSLWWGFESQIKCESPGIGLFLNIRFILVNHLILMGAIPIN